LKQVTEVSNMWRPWWKYKHWVIAWHWFYHIPPPWACCCPPSPEEELRFLESLKKDLEAELNEVSKRIEELKKRLGVT